VVLLSGPPGMNKRALAQRLIKDDPQERWVRLTFSHQLAWSPSRGLSIIGQSCQPNRLTHSATGAPQAERVHVVVYPSQLLISFFMPWCRPSSSFLMVSGSRRRCG
jgi:hypothetical protein